MRSRVLILVGFVFLLALIIGQPGRVLGVATYGTPQPIGSNGTSGWDNAWADYDGDGDLDFVQAQTATSGYGANDGGAQPNDLYLNNGNGTFTEIALNLDNLPSYAAAAADFDGDGDMDVAIGNVGQNYLYINAGGADFIASAQFGSGSTTHVSWGDCDGDGDPDLAVANRGTGYTDPAQNYLYINNGDGTFTERSEFGGDATYHITWVDYDGDGDLDAAVANYGQNYLYVNDGTCHFTARSEFGNLRTQDIEFGDLDGDGDLDAAVANGTFGMDDYASSIQNQICWNNGGNFICVDALGAYNSQSASIGDTDRDGDLDIIITNHTDTQPSILYDNDGSGNFTEHPLDGTADGNDQYWKARGQLVDITGNSMLDYAAAQFCHHSSCPAAIWLQNESPVPTPTPTPTPTSTSALTPTPSPSGSGLVAEYRFETCGSNHYPYTGDHTETLPHGLLKGDTSITADGDGKIYRAYHSDGTDGSHFWVIDDDNGTPDDETDDRLTNPVLDILGDLTLSLWVYPEDSMGGVLIGRSHDGEFWVALNWDMKLEYAHSGAGSVTSSASVAPNEWHHVAIVRTGSPGNYTVKFYVDGTLVDSLPYYEDNEATDKPLEIGACQYVCGGYNFHGRIDEVKIFNTALDDAEISQIYTNENNGLNYDGSERCSGWCEPGALSTLVNGSFEDTPAGSSPGGWQGGEVSQSSSVDPKPDGVQYAFTWPDDLLYQDVSITPGGEYKVTFHSGTHQPEDGDKRVYIQYLDANHDPIGTPVVHVVTKDVDDDNLLSEMRTLRIGAAPANAAYLRVAADAGSSDYTKIDAVCLYGPAATPTPTPTSTPTYTPTPTNTPTPTPTSTPVPTDTPTPTPTFTPTPTATPTATPTSTPTSTPTATPTPTPTNTPTPTPTATPQATPALAISKAPSTNVVLIGDIVTFTVRITNTGETTIAWLPLRDAFDNTCLQYDAKSANPVENNRTDETIDWYDLTTSFGEDLAPGESFTVTIPFRAVAVDDDA
ncbi:MAG: hypothetical protein GXO55_04925, partial [Chloroflexi bacterium]|nr:hypothetical protein [Chloroflexota bacterium]